MRLCTFLPGRRLLPGARAVGGGPPGLCESAGIPGRRAALSGRYACAACISAESGNDVKRTIFQQSARSGCDLQGASGIADGDDAFLSGTAGSFDVCQRDLPPSGGTDHGVKWCAA